MTVWYPGHLSRAVGIAGISLVIAGAIVMSDRDSSQRREIARLSSVCPPAEAGEKLVSTIRQERGDQPASMRCIYTSNNGYGRSTHIRPAVPGRAS